MYETIKKKISENTKTVKKSEIPVKISETINVGKISENHVMYCGDVSRKIFTCYITNVDWVFKY